MAKISLIVEVDAAKGTAEIKRFAQESETATKKAGDAAKEGGKGFGQFASALEDTAKKLSALLTPANLFGTVIGVTIVSALKSAGNHAFEFSSELRRLSLVTGDSLGRVAEFQGAVDKLGVGSDKLGRAFFFLSSEMENGGKNLAKLGISLQTAEGYEKSVIDVTEEIGDKFRAMGAGADVAAAARKLLSRQAIDLLPIFQLEREEIKRLGEEERRFSEQIGDEGLKSLVKFKGSLMEVGGAVTRVQTLLVLDLAPAFKKVADFVSAAVDALLLIPAPVRLAGEYAAAAVIGIIALSLVMKALAAAAVVAQAALNIGWIAALATGWGELAIATKLLIAGLTLLIIYGPEVAAAIGRMLPQFIIDGWHSFTSSVNSAYQAVKNFVGLGGASAHLPEPPKVKREATEADEQQRLQFTQQLTAAQIALGQATMTSEAAQVDAIKRTLTQRLDELAVAAKFDLVPEHLAHNSQLVEAEKKTAAAKIAQIATQTNLQLLAIEEQTAELRLAIEGKSREAALAVRVDDIEQSKKLVADEYAAFGLSQAGYVQETIRLNGVELAAKQTAIAQEIAQVEAAQKLKTIYLTQQVTALAITQAKANEEIVKLQADSDAKVLDLRTKSAAAGREVTNQNIELEKKARQEESIFVAQAENKDLALKMANLEAYKQAHAESAQVMAAATAEQYRLLKSAYDKDVQNYIDAQLKQTGILEDEVGKRLAKEAGLINSLKQLRQQQIDNQATVLEQQARLAGDLGAAFDVGFAHAATSADDAFTAMKKAGADAYQSLKSGLSDFLFDVFTGAKTIGDVFVNLGKRILRSMTDVFAEIIVKQAVMASGFSLTGLLGLGTTVAGAAGMEGAPNAAAKAITDLGSASGETAGTIGFLGGTVNVVMRVLTMFGNGLMGILGFFGQIVQGIASGGGIVNTLTTAFGGLVKSGGALFGIFNGLSNVGSSLFSVFTEGTSLANVFQTAFNALGLTSGGFASAAGTASWGAATSATGSAPLAAGQLAGSFASFLGEWVPIAGALYMAAMAIQNFFSGGAATKIGTGIGLVLAGPFGAYVGGIIGGLFEPAPKMKLDASIVPFHRAAIGTDVIGKGGLPGTQVGAALIDVGGNIMKGSKERALQEVLATMVNDLLIRVVDATVLMIKTLPPTIGTQLDAALTQMEVQGLEIVDQTWKGGKAGKKFQKRIKGLMEETLREIVVALDFGDVDLKALGFDPKDPKGKKGGEVARGFEGMMMALGALSAIVKEVGPGVDLAGVSLAQFTKGAIDLFKGFATEGEAFTDTIKRVMQTFGEIIAIKDQIHASLAAISSGMTEVVSIIKTQMANAEASMVSMVDALTVAIESGAKPEEVLAAAKAAAQAVTDTLKMEIDAVTAMHDAVVKMNTAITDGVDLIVSLTAKIDTLRGASADPAFMQAGIDGIVALFNQLTDVTSRISLFASGLALLSESTEGILGNIPLVVAGFNQIMSQIRELANPTEAIAALKGLAGAVESGLNAGIAAINRQTQARIAGLNAERSAIGQNTAAAKSALEAQKATINETFNTQKTALQTALSLSQQWVSVLTSVKAQLVDLFNLLAPTHPLTSLNDVQAQFNAAFAAFQASPTAEGATQVQELARQLLQLAQQTPGYDLPSAAFQALAATVRTALESIQTFAASQPSQEAIQAQIAALEAEQAASLANIDAQIQALDANQAAALASIDAQIAQANADGQASIQYLQELAAQGLEAIRAQLVIEVTALAADQAKAAEALQAVLGDKSFEEFIATKQAEAADLLRGIDQTLRLYLGAIITNLFPGTGVPQLAGGMDYVPSNRFPAYLDRGERVLTASENRDYGSGKGGGTTTVTITLAPTIQIQGGSSSQMKSDLDKALVELVNGPSLTRPALLELAKRAS